MFLFQCFPPQAQCGQRAAALFIAQINVHDPGTPETSGGGGGGGGVGYTIRWGRGILGLAQKAGRKDSWWVETSEGMKGANETNGIS